MVMTKKEAKALGLKKYLGVECKRGHRGWRYTYSGACIECRSLYYAAEHMQAPPLWEVIEERVHKYDVAAVRAYCASLRERRGY